jgi:DNA-binding NarL/FixJ family response regulator
MRVLLVGRPKDRDRVRTELLEAGLEITAESATAPDAASSPPGLDPDVDAIVMATPLDSHPGRAFGPGLREANGASAGRGGRGDEDPSRYEESLTAREHDVLALVAEGLPNKAIAHALGISDQTVKFHVAAIIGKLGAANRTDAVRRAIRRGLVAV